MRLDEMVQALDLEVLTEGIGLDRSVSNGYTGDLLSDVLARARSGDLWSTIQRHANVVAVAKMTGIAGIVIAGGVRPSEEVLGKARVEGVPIFATPEPLFTITGRIHRLLFPEEG
jgi:predicted transcriptional regulator